ncbi:MAG: glycine betaine ABC transporter substrate-binding protein [Thermoguttaceae bacterium]
MALKFRLWILLGSIILSGIVLLAVDPLIRDAAKESELRAAFDAEFLSRPDGYSGLCRQYGFAFAEEPTQMAPGLMYRAAADGSVDVIDAFATDGRIAAFDLVVLEDDRHFFPPYYAAPLIRSDTLKKHAELRQVLNLMAGKLSDTIMRKLNYEVDENGKKPRDIAYRFLAESGLLKIRRNSQKSATDMICIGSKPFTEQEILGEMMALLIESQTSLQVERKLNLGGTMLCFNALCNGDIDLYPEYTGTGLVNILKLETSSDPEASYKTVKKAFAEQFDLIWLKPFGFNNSYTLTMRRQDAEELGIECISDLAECVRE